MIKLTIPEALLNTVEKFSDRPGLFYKLNGQYREIKWGEVHRKVNQLASFLLKQGFQRGQHVAILSDTRYEWAIADLASQAIGLVTIPVYPTLREEQIQNIIIHSEAGGIFVSDEWQLEKIRKIRSNLPDLFPIIIFDKPAEDSNDVTSLSDALEIGGNHSGDKDILRENVKSTKPDDLASIIYTSGTTGDPKGVMLTHDNFMFNVQSCTNVVPVNEQDLFLSFLPLSHVLERMAGYYLPLYIGASIAYAESIDTVAQNMAEMKPTVMISVPRLYEKMNAKIIETVESGSSIKRKLFYWALKKGEVYFTRHLNHVSIPLACKIKFSLADKLVLSKIREKTGGRLGCFISGGAPLQKETGEFFKNIGIIILEGFGLTETSPVTNLNPPEKIKFGTVGPVIPGVDVKIADDGEILTKSRSLMKGYYKNESATREAIDSKGWFHTGDIGFLDEDGYLKITDRKKNILVTSGGKNIYPQPIEQKLKDSVYIAEAVLIGDKRNYVTALLLPEKEQLTKFAVNENIQLSDISELIHHPKIIELFDKIVSESMANYARYEQVKKYTVLPVEFSIDTGEYTPTLKIKRKVIEEKFIDEINSMYEG
ncbi:MAG: long-chain fatty acid--CoA ligase [Calditrichaceae bacterium]